MGLKAIVRAIAALALFLNAGAAMAAKAGKIEMQSRMWEEASGEVTIKDTAENMKEITVKAENLVPDSVFTVWFVKEGAGGEKERVGEGKSFRTDENGDGLFSAMVPEAKIKDWDWIVIGFHPEGDPENIENVHVALAGELSEAG